MSLQSEIALLTPGHECESANVSLALLDDKENGLQVLSEGKAYPQIS